MCYLSCEQQCVLCPSLSASESLSNSDLAPHLLSVISALMPVWNTRSLAVFAAP